MYGHYDYHIYAKEERKTGRKEEREVGRKGGKKIHREKNSERYTRTSNADNVLFWFFSLSVFSKLFLSRIGS